MHRPSPILLAAALALACNGLRAQDLAPSFAAPERLEDVEVLMAAPPPLPLGGGDALMFLQFELGSPGEVVPGKPYSATQRVQTHQPLVDGNTITIEQQSRLFRDAAGRTRREDEVGPQGAREWRVTVTDPVAGLAFTLDPRRQEAYRLPDTGSSVTLAGPAPGGDGGFGLLAAATPVAGMAAGAASTADAFAAGAAIQLPFPGEPRSESLGEREHEGLRVTGSRTTVVIPAQAIGNRAPIEIVTEQWFCPELDVVVESLHRDPRIGETRYRLVDIRRGEPAAALFAIPPGYTVQDGAAPTRR